MGHPPEEALRTCMVATLLADRVGLSQTETRAVFYTALLQHVGCTAYAHETAVVLGDDIVLNEAGWRTNFTQPSEIFRVFLPALSAGRGPLERLRMMAFMVTAGDRYGRENNRAACEVGRETARRLGLPASVQQALHHALEYWNGSGGPQGLRGEAIAMPARVALVASMATLFGGAGGTDAAVAAVRQRRGGYLDPELADAFVEHAGAILDEVAAADPRTAVRTLEPRPMVRVPESDVVRVARAFGELVDLKSPYLHGHASGVAERARDAGARAGLDSRELAALEIAGHLHDLGRAAVPTTTWEKPGPLSTAEWERVRLHAYHSQRILTGSPALAPLAELAGKHHERLDRSGYHRGCGTLELPMAARILSAADAYQAMMAERPHRAALSPDRAASELQAEVRAGRLDADACAAVLASAGGGSTTPRRRWPDGLTDREIEVLRLLAAGGTNAAIGQRLGISPRTAEHHVQSIYSRIGCSSRAAAALYAMQHDLLKVGSSTDATAPRPPHPAGREEV